MLRPSYLEKLPAPMVSLIDKLQNEIIEDIVKRIVNGKYNTPSTEWMLYKANQLRLSSAAVNKLIARNAKVRERLVKELYTDAVKEALSEDAKIYRYAIHQGALPESSAAALKSYFRDIALNNTFRTGLAATNGLMRNLTRSMAAASNRMLSDALDLAWLEVASGAFTPDQACFKAVQKLSADGLKVVNYASGHRDQVDVAVNRAIRTGINKTCCEMQTELAGDVGCDLVEVTAHLGARPSHAEWQGQIYSLSGKNPKYEDFSSATGYGTGEGLGGWNCRHSFYPYFEGLSVPASVVDFTAEENLEMYEDQQKQRAYERAVRRSKRELAGLDAARQSTTDPKLKEKLDREFARKSVTLKRREERLSQFCKDKGLMPDNSRVRVVGFGRSEAQKAVHSANKLYLEQMHGYGIKNPPETLAKFNQMRYNNSKEFQLMNNYIGSVKSGALSPLAGYDLYKEYHEKIEKELIGQKTSNGIEIKSQSVHLLERVFGTMSDSTHLDSDGNPVKRSGVSFEDMKDALLNGNYEPIKETKDEKGDIKHSQLFYNDNCAVSVNPDTGNIIQCNPQ